MDYSIECQTFQMIESTNTTIQNERLREKECEKRVGKTNRLNTLQNLEKDVILPSDHHEGVKGGKVAKSKPQLPSPTKNWSGLTNGEENEPGLIAIMGQVLALQAKTNSNFWSTLWKQASQSMELEVKFAPVIGNAMRSQFGAEATATRIQAEQSKQEGMINISTFCMGVAMAGYMEYKDPNEPTSEDDDKEFGLEKKAPAKNIASETDKSISNIDKEIDDETTSSRQRFKKGWNKVKTGMTKGQKRFTGFLLKSAQTSTMMSSASQGFTSYFVSAPLQNKKAIYEGLQGQYAAVSKEAEQYAQFYGQSFSRTEDLRQGSSQNIDYAMNILKSAADALTQTVTSMFRG